SPGNPSVAWDVPSLRRIAARLLLPTVYCRLPTPCKILVLAQPGAALWIKCTRCGELLYQRELEKNHKVCHKCQFHFRLRAPERLALFVDEDSFEELDGDLRSTDHLRFTAKGKSYADRLVEAEEQSGLSEAVLYGTARLGGTPLVVAAMDASFLGASM